MRVFYLTWIREILSQLGSGLTSFALSVWVYQQTQSATKLTLILFLANLPTIVLLPAAGVLVDRWDRGRALMLSEAGASLTPLLLAALLAAGRLEIWHIYMVVTLSGAFAAIQVPAFSAATTLLVPKKELGRASGMVQLGLGIAQLLSPVLGGALLPLIGLHGIFVIDFASFVISVGALLFIRIPKPPMSAEGRRALGPFWSQITYGWRYILARPGLLGLLLLIATSNYTISAVVALAPALVLSFADARTLGLVLSTAGVGMLASSLWMSVWRGTGHRIRAVFAGVLLSSVAVFAAGLAPSAILFGAMAFIGAAGGPIVSASSQAIWQRKVAPDVQGKVFATRAMIAMSAGPIAFLTSGPLADYVFNPLLVARGPLASTVGKFLGVGPARGIGLFFLILGAVGLLMLAIASRYAPLRRVESDLPDAIGDGER